MKKILLFIVLIIFSFSSLYSQEKFNKSFYIGLGTGVSTYLGGDFGSRFAFRVSNSYYDNYYDNYYYNNNYHRYYNRYNDNYGREPISSYDPLQFDLVVGLKASKLMAFELQTSVFWHSNGRVDPQFDVTENGNYTYVDRYANSTLVAVPIMAAVKIYPLGAINSPFYLSAAVGVQYTHESLQRVRSVEYIDYYGYDNQLYEYPLAEWNGEEWYKGIKLSMGVSYNLFQYLSGDVELAFSNFFPVRWNDSPLAMYRSRNISNISLGTKIYFRF